MLAGSLSYFGRPLVPAVFVHAMADSIGFVTASGFFGLRPIYTSYTVWETGIKPGFVTATLMLLVGGAVTVHIFKRLATLDE